MTARGSVQHSPFAKEAPGAGALGTGPAPGKSSNCCSYGSVIIEWPPMRAGLSGREWASILPGWGCAILDAETGGMITTVEKLSIPAVTADAVGPVTVWLAMFADEDGNPVLDGKPHVRDGEVITGTFPFFVAEMRVRQPEPTPEAAA